MVTVHEKLIEQNIKTYHSMMKYEEIAVDYFSNCDVNKRTLTSPEAGDVKQKIMDTFAGVKNPYKDALVWVMGEQLDMKGMLDALNGRENVMKQQQSCENKRRDN